MTPQEKAKDLIDKFVNSSVVVEEENFFHPKPYSLAKQCALIAVDELINATQYESHIHMAFNPCETTEYWLEVKTYLQP